MSTPQVPQAIGVKRPRNEAAPDTLILQRKYNKTHHNDRTELHYIRRKRDDEDVISTSIDSDSGGEVPASRSAACGVDGLPDTSMRPDPGKRRIYRLHRDNSPGHHSRQSRWHANAQVTFSEPKPDDMRIDNQAQSLEASPPPRVFKRPGKNAAVNPRRIDSSAFRQLAPSMDESKRVRAMADKLHQLTLGEVSKQARSKVPKAAVPTLSGIRSRELHEQRIAETRATNDQNGSQNMVDDDGDYVLDTYELAPDDGFPSRTQPSNVEALGRVGYLVLSEEDEEIWEHYQEDEPGDKEWDPDEEDENAEGYYGADYPEDEEHMYQAERAASSDDEMWDENTGTYSDEDYESTMNPWKARTQAQLAEYLERADNND